MKRQQCLHISNLQYIAPRISLLRKSSPITSERIYYDQILTPYPQDTKAFLYYSTSPEKPRIAGEIRLRVTSGNDPGFFKSGSDLLRPDGRPWSLPLYILSKAFLPLYEKLREDRFISDDFHSVLEALPSRRYQFELSQVLYRLNDTFIIDFSSRTVFFVITERGVERLPFDGVFLDEHKSGRYRGAYTSHHLSIFLY